MWRSLKIVEQGHHREALASNAQRSADDCRVSSDTAGSIDNHNV